MKEKTQYRTRQRAAIIDYLKRLDSRHVTATDIQQDLFTQGERIGLSTIYRQLERLVEEGLLRKYSLDGHAGACYQYQPGDGGCAEHYHLKCEGCGMLIHLDCHMFNDMQQHIQREHGFSVNSNKTVLYGTCQHCATGLDRRTGDEV